MDFYARHADEKKAGEVSWGVWRQLHKNRINTEFGEASGSFKCTSERAQERLLTELSMGMSFRKIASTSYSGLWTLNFCPTKITLRENQA